MVDNTEISLPPPEATEQAVVWFLQKGTTTCQVTDAAKVERLKAAGYVIIPAEEGMRLWEEKRSARNTFLDITSRADEMLEQGSHPKPAPPPLPKAPDNS